jgi:hypothetical protein
MHQFKNRNLSFPIKPLASSDGTNAFKEVIYPKEEIVIQVLKLTIRFIYSEVKEMKILSLMIFTA